MNCTTPSRMPCPSTRTAMPNAAVLLPLPVPVLTIKRPFSVVAAACFFSWPSRRRWVMRWCDSGSVFIECPDGEGVKCRASRAGTADRANIAALSARRGGADFHRCGDGNGHATECELGDDEAAARPGEQRAGLADAVDAELRARRPARRCQ